MMEVKQTEQTIHEGRTTVTTEATVTRRLCGAEGDTVMGLNLAPVRPGYHRWPEDESPAGDGYGTPTTYTLCLVLGQLAWRQG